MIPAPSREKDPNAVALGRRSALKRWGAEPARTVRMADLPAEERAAVWALVERLRASREKTT
jgi:hypothetical protein